MNTKTLSQLITDNAEAIVDVFVGKVRQHDLPPSSADQQDVRDDLQLYVRYVGTSLDRGHHDLADAAAKEHGKQRWYVGYDLRSVILEYGVLRSSIVEVVDQTDYRMTHKELEELATVLDAGGAEAAIEFTTRSAKELNTALAEAQAAVRSREDVVAVVSHDLKNPLSIVHGSLGPLKKLLLELEPGPRAAQLNKIAVRIEYATRRMNRLITDLLDLAKIREGRLEVSFKDELTAQLMAEAFHQMSALAEQRPAELLIEELTKARVRCDHDRVIQVLDNLIGNAIKFSPEGGTVTLRVEAAGPVCTFSVRDEGPGIPQEQLPMLFDRFWRAPRVTSVSGTGLGLAIAKEIVEAHQGRIWVESIVGKGSSFFFTLPRSPD